MSAVAKHTPGPWIAAPFSSIVGAPVVSQQGRTVAKIAYPLTPGMPQAAIDESVANGHLISAAPELLDIVRHLVRWHDQLGAADIERAVMVLAKAEGRPF